jgi:hypothetical protein
MKAEGSNSVVAITGHNSPDTVHLTFAYPFGRTRCLRRKWIEHATSGLARDQSRFVTQTTMKAFNPIVAVYGSAR